MKLYNTNWEVSSGIRYVILKKREKLFLKPEYAPMAAEAPPQNGKKRERRSAHSCDAPSEDTLAGAVCYRFRRSSPRKYFPNGFASRTKTTSVMTVFRPI